MWKSEESLKVDEIVKIKVIFDQDGNHAIGE